MLLVAMMAVLAVLMFLCISGFATNPAHRIRTRRVDSPDSKGIRAQISTAVPIARDNSPIDRGEEAVLPSGDSGSKAENAFTVDIPPTEPPVIPGPMEDSLSNEFIEDRIEAKENSRR